MFRNTFTLDLPESLDFATLPRRLPPGLLDHDEFVAGLGELDQAYRFPSPQPQTLLRGQQSLPNMGTLTDVTTKVGNQQRYDTPTVPSKPTLNASTTRDCDYKSNSALPGPVRPWEAMAAGANSTPRYMSPTLASRSQSITPDMHSQTMTPTTDDKGRSWVTSAARRVGLVRVPDSAPKSKKEVRNLSKEKLVTSKV